MGPFPWERLASEPRLPLDLLPSCWLCSRDSGPVCAKDRSISIVATIGDINAALAKGTLTSERLSQMFLARIDAYDRKGPALRAVITVNPKALETARAMDAERKTKGPRSPLHGIPIIIKDNIDTADMPTTGGSVLLEGSMPPDDAFVVKQLRAAGAMIIAKANLSEFASGAAHSSLGGQILNPHDLARTPSGSSGGTGASMAAAFAMAGLGTDTGGSVRGPSTANGIAGLKTTMGLVSRDGVIPLALSFDTVGPMAQKRLRRRRAVERDRRRRCRRCVDQGRVRAVASRTTPRR